MLGGAIGDALGGPVEGRQWTPELLRETYGDVNRMLPYEREVGHHAHFSKEPGIYTDDTRLKHLLCQAIIEANGMPRPGDFGHVLARAYHQAPDDLHEGFLEEYYLKAIWGRDKVIFSGEPTNGAIMGNSPIGLIAACQPEKAYQAGFDLAFVTDGYAKTAAALLVAAIASAMKAEPTIEDVMESATQAHLNFAKRREGPHWYELEWRYDPNLHALNKALEIAHKEKDTQVVQKALYESLEWGHLFSEATHTLVVPLAMFVATDGDFHETVIACVMYARDNDSYASVAGALAGAFHGIDAIPKVWQEVVLKANPDPDIYELSLKITEIIAEDYQKAQALTRSLRALL